MLDLRKVLNKTFRDKDGRIILAQSPNLPLAGWILAEIISFLVGKVRLRNAFSDLASALLFTWAYLEITRGVNYFRKLLGLAIILLIIFNYFAS